MENTLENLTIGVFAKAAGVNEETIRFYQRKGLLPEPDKPYGSIRRYGEADVTRVRFVKSAQRLGFSLDEIAELLRLEDGTHCEEASSLAECWRRLNSDPPCRSNIDPGRIAEFGISNCG